MDRGEKKGPTHATKEHRHAVAVLVVAIGVLFRLICKTEKKGAPEELERTQNTVGKANCTRIRAGEKVKDAA